MRATGVSALVLAISVFSLLTFAQEPPPQEPPPEEPAPPAEPAAPSEEASADDELVSIDEMKALSDSDLRELYLDTPWKLPPDFGEDEELLERIMSLVHPETEPEPEQDQTETPPKPKPDAR